MQENPNDAAADEGLAWAAMHSRTNKGRNWPDAIKYFRETVRLQPENSGAWLMLSSCLRKTGNKAEAIEILKKMVNDKDFGSSARKSLAQMQASTNIAPAR